MLDWNLEKNLGDSMADFSGNLRLAYNLGPYGKTVTDECAAGSFLIRRDDSKNGISRDSDLHLTSDAGTGVRAEYEVG
jgi:hypothetical protein